MLIYRRTIEKYDPPTLHFTNGENIPVRDGWEHDPAIDLKPGKEIVFKRSDTHPDSLGDYGTFEQNNLPNLVEEIPANGQVEIGADDTPGDDLDPELLAAWIEAGLGPDDIAYETGACPFCPKYDDGNCPKYQAAKLRAAQRRASLN